MAHGLNFCFFLQGIHQLGAGFISRHARNGLEFFDTLLMHFIDVFQLFVDDLGLGCQIVFECLGFFLFALNFFVALVQRHFALFEFVFDAQYPFVLFLITFFDFRFHLNKLLFSFEDSGLLDHIRFLACIFEQDFFLPVGIFAENESPEKNCNHKDHNLQY
ncbi:hypothetical protein DSECCO2_550350 [anaerobic digester metagenome]